MMKIKYIKQLLLIGFLIICSKNTFAQSKKCPAVKNINTIVTEYYSVSLLNNQVKKLNEAPIEIKEESFDKNGLPVWTKNSATYEEDSYITLWTYSYSAGQLASIKEVSEVNNKIIPEDTKEKLVKSTNTDGLPALITDKENKVKWIYSYKDCLEVKREYSLIDWEVPNYIRKLKYNDDGELIKEISIDKTFSLKASVTTYSHYKKKQKRRLGATYCYRL